MWPLFWKVYHPLSPPILQGKFVVIMTSTGKIFSQPIVPSVTANDGPVYFTMGLDISHPSVVAGSDGVINGGGASVYYSQTLKMLFFSYFNGTESETIFLRL